jgi:hypothetical protein
MKLQFSWQHICGKCKETKSKWKKMYLGASNGGRQRLFIVKQGLRKNFGGHKIVVFNSTRNRIQGCW